MRVIAVLDLMQGRVVRGIGGMRNEYRPIQSPLVADPDPLAVAAAFARRLGIREFYVADLDAIGGGDPAWPVYRQLLSHGYSLWIDAGLRHTQQARRLAEVRAVGEDVNDAHSTQRETERSRSPRTPRKTATSGDHFPLASSDALQISRIIAALETLPDFNTLEQMLAVVGQRRLVLSLDLRDGRPMLSSDWTGPNDIERIAQQAHRLGVRRFIVLDVARVGRGEGTGTIELCRRVRDLGEIDELVAGGGIRHAKDLRPLAEAGCHAVLLATALHDGRITRADLDDLN